MMVATFNWNPATSIISCHSHTDVSDETSNSKWCFCKYPKATPLFVVFAKAFYSIHRGEMEQILFACDLAKETVAAIMMLYKNTKVKVRSSDGDTGYLDIVAGVLQGDTLAPHLFIICLDYILRMSIYLTKENGFTVAEKKKQ